MQKYTIELIQAVMLLLLPRLEKTQAVKREFSKFQNKGVITPSDSELANLLHQKSQMVISDVAMITVYVIK